MERKPNIIAIVMAIFMIAMGGTPIFGNQVKTLDVRTLQESIREVSTAPVLEVNESDNTITVSLSLNYINIIGDSRSGAQIGIDGFTINMNPGEPETPVKTINHKIPDGMSADIVKDSYGGNWGRGIAKSQNEWTYVDFSNGERHKISPTDDKCFSIKEFDGGIVDIDIEGAYVFSHVNSPDKEYWEIGDQIWSRLIDLDSSTAQLPAIQYEFLLGDNENPNNIKVIDYDRITIPNVDFMGALMRVDLLTPDGSDPDYALKVFPYDGECPDFFIETESVSTYIDKYKKCHCIITILPVRYNSVTKEAYVYRHLRLQRTDSASVDLTEIETSDAVYHTIDGRVEPSPETGRIYIRSIGSKREKIVYSGK